MSCVCFSSDLRRRRDVTALYRRQRPHQVQLDEIHPLRQTLWGAEHDGCTIQVRKTLISSRELNEGSTVVKNTTVITWIAIHTVNKSICNIVTAMKYNRQLL